MEHVHTALLRGLAHVGLTRLTGHGRASDEAHDDEQRHEGGDGPQGRIGQDDADVGEGENAGPEQGGAGGHGSGGLGFGFAGLHAQHVPGDVRTQVLAAHDATGCALDFGTALGGHSAHTARPLPDKLRRATDRGSDGGLPSVGLFHVFGERHSPHVKRAALFNQAARLLPCLSGSLGIEYMKTIGEIRRANLELLVAEFGTLDAVAGLGGTSSVYLSQVRKQALDKETGRPREMGTRIARRLESGASKDPGWMDVDHADEGALAVAEPAPPYEAKPQRTVSESQWALLEDFDMLPDDEKAALRNTLKAKADHVRKIVAEYLGKRGVTGSVSNARVEETYGAPPPPSPVGSYERITPIPAPRPPAKKVRED